VCILLHFSQQIFVHTSCCWHLTLSHNDHGSNAPSFDILIPLVCNAGYHGHFIYPSNVDTRYKSNGCISCVSCVGCPKQKGGQKKSKVAVRSDMNCSKRHWAEAFMHWAISRTLRFVLLYLRNLVECSTLGTTSRLGVQNI